MKKEIQLKLMWALLAVVLVMSLIFAYTDHHKTEWKGNPEYFEMFEEVNDGTDIGGA